jgi:hypothetical protein
VLTCSSANWRRWPRARNPLGTIRDPERNEIVFPLERNKAHFLDGFALLVELFARYNRSHEPVS